MLTTNIQVEQKYSSLEYSVKRLHHETSTFQVHLYFLLHLLQVMSTESPSTKGHLCQRPEPRESDHLR